MKLIVGRDKLDEIQVGIFQGSVGTWFESG